MLQGRLLGHPLGPEGHKNFTSTLTLATQVCLLYTHCLVFELAIPSQDVRSASVTLALAGSGSLFQELG